jgi:hypothetical protein
MNHRLQRGGYAIALSIASLVAACSASDPPSSVGGEPGSFDETTGAIIAHLKRIPGNVRCLEIQTSDWRNSYTQRDVTPGEEAFVRIGPLLPGYLSIWGAASSESCADLWAVDGGQFYAQTWHADYTSLEITPGRAIPVSLAFRRVSDRLISASISTIAPTPASPASHRPPMAASRADRRAHFCSRGAHVRAMARTSRPRAVSE